MTRPSLHAIITTAVAVGLAAAAQATSFDFKDQLFGAPSTLSVNLQTVDTTTGEVTANGADSQCPTTPFTWNWGDGEETTGFFPQTHTYGDLTRNYVITLTSHYTGGDTDAVQTQARFVAPEITPISHPSDIEVTIPDCDVSLSSRMPGYTPPATLTHYDDSHFGVVPRTDIEYVMTSAAAVQNGLVNGDVADVGGGFQQVILRDSNLSGGMYSLWYTDPVSFGAGTSAMQGSVPWSSFFHELGHNYTLNSPADYYYGGKIDGNANAIFSESMAQIFQHATAYIMINNADDYGLDDNLVFDIKESAMASMRLVRKSYDDYVSGGAVFCSWNDPATPQDETFNMFMTIAYKFFEEAENSGQGYEEPLERMMGLLQLFDEDMMNRYDRLHDNTTADAFRATLMVTAMSHGFATDLRDDFEALNFPIDDATYDELMAAVPEPATMFLLGTGLVGLIGVVRRRKR